MKTLLLLLGLFITHPKCGVYRWDVKLGIDKASLALYNKPPSKVSVTELSKLERNPDYREKVTVRATVIMCGKEADGDYHIVLTDKDSMIVEIPDPDCIGLVKFPGYRKAYTAARKFVQDNISAKPASIKKVTPIKVTVTGYVFFDKIAHGSGHSRNGVEIHPVLKIEK